MTLKYFFYCKNDKQFLYFPRNISNVIKYMRKTKLILPIEIVDKTSA